MVVEIVMYRLKSGCEAEFRIAHDDICHQLESIPGFISLKSVAAIGDSRLRCDHCLWQSLALAESSKPAFKALPGAKRFLSLIEEGSIVGGIFRHEQLN